MWPIVPNAGIHLNGFGFYEEGGACSIRNNLYLKTSLPTASIMRTLFFRNGFSATFFSSRFARFFQVQFNRIQWSRSLAGRVSYFPYTFRVTYFGTHFYVVRVGLYVARCSPIDARIQTTNAYMQVIVIIVVGPFPSVVSNGKAISLIEDVRRVTICYRNAFIYVGRGLQAIRRSIYVRS